MRRVVLCGGMLVKMARLMQPVVERSARRCEREAHAPVSLAVGAGTHRVDIGKRALDLLEDGDRVGRRVLALREREVGDDDGEFLPSTGVFILFSHIGSQYW